MRLFKTVALTTLLTPSLLLGAADEAEAWIYMDTCGVIIIGVIAVPEGEWSDYYETGYVRSEPGDNPANLTVVCSDEWVEGVLGIPYKVNGKWRRDVALRGQNNGAGLETCDIKDTSESPPVIVPIEQGPKPTFEYVE